jgi:hypothetical protein
VSNLTDASRPSLLSPAAFNVVQATAPVVAAHAGQITAHFYPRMFAAHPELLRVFNQGNQATGEQSKALAGSVVAYAVQLIDPEAPSHSTTSGTASPTSTSRSEFAPSSTRLSASTCSPL